MVTYMTLGDCWRNDVRKHMLRALRAYQEGNPCIAHERMAKAARALRRAKLYDLERSHWFQTGLGEYDADGGAAP